MDVRKESPRGAGKAALEFPFTRTNCEAHTEGAFVDRGVPFNEGRPSGDRGSGRASGGVEAMAAHVKWWSARMWGLAVGAALAVLILWA